MAKDREKLFSVLDVLMSEYGWSLEYCLKLPGDVVKSLFNAIQTRKLNDARTWTKLIGAAVSAGFSGKIDKLDSIFKAQEDESKQTVDEGAWKSQVKAMWMRMHTKGRNLSADEYKKLDEEFENKWKAGESINF